MTHHININKYTHNLMPAKPAEPNRWRPTNTLHDETKMNELTDYLYSKYNVELTREPNAVEYDHITHVAVPAKSMMNLLELYSEPITPETLYATLVMMSSKDNHNNIIDSVVNSYYRRLMLTETQLKLAVIAAFTPSTERKTVVNAYVAIALNLFNVTPAHIADMLIEDTLVDFITHKLVRTSYKNQSPARVIDNLYRYYFDYKLSVDELDNIRGRLSSEHNLLATIVNDKKAMNRQSEYVNLFNDTVTAPRINLLK